MSWVAVYHIGVDGYVAQNVELTALSPKWLIPISDKAAEKLQKIGSLPCKALLGADERDDATRLEERILAYEP